VTDPESVSSVHVNDKMKNLAQDFFNNKQTKSEKKPLPVRKFSEPSIELVKPSGRKMSDSTFEITRPSARKLSGSNFEITRPNLANFSKEESPFGSIPSPSISRKSSVTSFATPPTSRKSSEQRSSTIDKSCEEISGINKGLCSLAQSYFQSPQKPVARKTSTVKMDQADVKNEVEEVDQKTSLVASFFGPTSNNKSSSLQKANKPNVNIQERASYEPENVSMVDEEDEDDEIERIIKAAEMKEKRSSTTSSTSSVAPPIPVRSGESRAMAMMKRLGTVTGIMQGKH